MDQSSTVSQIRVHSTTLKGTARDEVEQAKAAIDMPVVLGELRALAGQVCRNADAFQLLLFRLGKATEGLALEKAAKMERIAKA